jgi:glucose-1-phosphate thymidylyltransferase
VEGFSHQPDGAKVMLKKVKDPERFGVAEVKGERLVRIEEKPKQPKSDLAVVGIYFYDKHVFDMIRTLKPSGRNELEVTDLNNAYIEKGTMTYEVLEGWWTDAGTFDSLRRATNLVAETGANQIDFTPVEET